MDDPRNRAPQGGAPADELARLVNGFYISQAISVAARLGLADLMSNGPVPVEEMAAKIGAHPRALHRLLRALASVGVFAEREGGTFGLTPMAEKLRSDVPGSFRGFALLPGEPSFWGPWGELLYSVKTGKTAFSKVYGMDVWEWREKNPEAGRVFNDAMTALSDAQSKAIVDSYDFSIFKHVIDVGGGHGALVQALAKAHPQLRGTVFDLAFVTERANTSFAAEGLGERCHAVSGDMFKSVPGGGDAYLFKYIMHDWEDDRAADILRTCRKAIGTASAPVKLLVFEQVIPPGNGPHPSKLLDLQMLVSAGGRERTEEEFASLFEAGGFRLERVVPTPSAISVIEGVPV
ncbi:acetylserotonin O-methyltransferase [Pendulispora brunnea]|uniref:Acetylserotonin O-methyltransferase n=1 Tax=Pendulispora brunnea TaxID=2905690 RepID=A0ABZ2JWR3_9BACT